MAKVLVTGGNGFIGSHLVRALVARGDDVRCMVRRPQRCEHLARLGARLVVGDVTSAENWHSAIDNADVVFHVAGCTRAVHADEIWRVNVGGVANAVTACERQTNPPVLVYVSSLAAAGPTSDRPLTEADPPHPVSEYGRSKLAAEREAALHADRVPITVVRPPITLGEGDMIGLKLFRTVAWLRLHVTPMIGGVRYSVIHADDLASLLILAAQRGSRLRKSPPDENNGSVAPPGVYFAAAEDSAYADLGRMIARAVGRRFVACVSMISPLIWMVAGANECLGRLLGRARYLNLDKAREATAGSWLCSAQRARAELGFAPAAPLLDRLRQTAEAYREEGLL